MLCVHCHRSIRLWRDYWLTEEGHEGAPSWNCERGLSPSYLHDPDTSEDGLLLAQVIAQSRAFERERR